MGKRIVMLVGSGVSARFMYNGLKNEFDISHVVRAGSAPGAMRKFLKRRVKRLGYGPVLGQVLFRVLGVRALDMVSKERVREIESRRQLSDADFAGCNVVDVPSVNSKACLRTLRAIDPDIIIVNGTAIIRKRILNGVDATFVNTHAGITPKYRGVHGGYWALVNGDEANCGVTVHLVDAGVDTGGILYQGTIEVTERDNFTTYPYLQIGEGIELMKRALNDIIDGTASPKEGGAQSKQWYHPTLWGYLYTRATRGVR